MCFLSSIRDVSPIWFATMGFVAVFLLVSTGIKRHRRRRLEKRLAKLRGQYGEPQIRDRELNVYVAHLRQRKTPGTCYVDDSTWRDLDLDSVFALIDRTLSTPGEIELHRFMRCLATSSETLQERDAVATILQRNSSVREAIQLKLDALGRTNYAAGIIDIIWDGELPDTRWRSLVTGLTLVSVAAMGSLAATSMTPYLGFAVVVTVALYLINLVVHYRYSSQHAYLITQLRYLSKLVQIAGQLPQLDDIEKDGDASALSSRLESLKSAHERTKAIPKATQYLLHSRKGSTELLDLLMEYVSIITLAEVRALMRASDAIRACRPDLQSLAIGVGEIDALQAVASFREGIQAFTRPEFVSAKQLRIDNAVHPLLENAVANSISISRKQYLITGSNMSGKSTILRTVGVNAVLAQSVFTCLATAYRGNFFHVMSSITPSDNLLEGKSYYLAEAERLHEMIRAADATITVLCIIDEVLRGTNTKERVAAATAILSHLSKLNAVVIAATHDMELTELLSGPFESHHFTERIDEEGIHFDYQIRPGSAKSTNAIRLLELLGYPPEVIRQATDCHKDAAGRTETEL